MDGTKGLLEWASVGMLMTSGGVGSRLLCLSGRKRMRKH